MSGEFSKVLLFKDKTQIAEITYQIKDKTRRTWMCKTIKLSKLEVNCGNDLHLHSILHWKNMKSRNSITFFNIFLHKYGTFSEKWSNSAHFLYILCLSLSKFEALWNLQLMHRWTPSFPAFRQGCYCITNFWFIFFFCLFSWFSGTFKNILSEITDEKIRCLNVILSLGLSEADKVKN